MRCPLCRTGKHSASCCPLTDQGRIDEPLQRKYLVDKKHWGEEWQEYDRLGLTHYAER